MKYILLLFLITSCNKNLSCNIIPNYVRLQEITVDCNNKTYGECIIEYDSALKKSNQDKNSIRKQLENN